MPDELDLVTYTVQYTYENSDHVQRKSAQKIEWETNGQTDATDCFTFLAKA